MNKEEIKAVLKEMRAQDRFGVPPRASKIGEWVDRLKAALGDLE